MNDRLQRAYAGRSVLVTGHTGFKGAWLTEWLLLLGARVAGYSCDVPTTPSLFCALGLHERMAADVRADVRSLPELRAELERACPDFIFHLAAQPIVRRSYDQPHDTLGTNVLGTLNVLEAVRVRRRPCVVIIVTSDKVYENAGAARAFVEDDQLGGHDPYSASKACAELVCSSYRRSFFPSPEGVAVATARAGNVIGGGDWAEDRLVPDCIRALAAERPIRIRNKHASRAWQHVLEPVSGYLELGAAIHEARERAAWERAAELCSAFNFGPSPGSQRSVEEVVCCVLKHWPGRWEESPGCDGKHEAATLDLDSSKAARLLGWRARWEFERSVAETTAWYAAFCQHPGDFSGLVEITRAEIRAHHAGQPDTTNPARNP